MTSRFARWRISKPRWPAPAATVMAWLQDFSLGVDYGPAEVRAQIQAAEDAGVLDFLLWDAAATYTRAALEP